MFLGEDLLVFLVLAVGGAMAAGNLAALVLPLPTKRDSGDLQRAPVWRCVVFVVLGLVATLWALASLMSG